MIASSSVADSYVMNCAVERIVRRGNRVVELHGRDTGSSAKAAKLPIHRR